MKFGLFFVNVGPFARPQAFRTLAIGAEQAGFESLWTIEHVAIPVGYKATYPYDPSGKIPIPEDIDLPDPLLPLAFAAAVTSKIKLATGVIILPQRHPLYIAKEAATLDVLADGRLILGVGIGWMKDEFDALGIPFSQRAGRTDETIRAMRSLWKASPEAFSGTYFNWGPLEMHPKPVHPKGVPIVIGGHSDGAARRAARFGDGFFPALFKPEDLLPLKAILAEECGRIGRDPGEIELTAILAGEDLDTVRRFEDLGVSRLLVGYGLGGDGTPGNIEDWLNGFAARVISKC